MISESARMSSTGEAHFRVQAPNSTPRATQVIALDAAGEEVVRRLAGAGWEHTTFLTAVPHLHDLSGRPRDLDEQIGMADLVVLVAGPGGYADAAAIIGEACSRRRVMTTGFLVGVASTLDRSLSKTLAQVRPWSHMVVIATGDEYIDDMLTALRA